LRRFKEAMDRIHRLGQHRPVQAIKLVIEDSIESRIVQVLFPTQVYVLDLRIDVSTLASRKEKRNDQCNTIY